MTTSHRPAFTILIHRNPHTPSHRWCGTVGLSNVPVGFLIHHELDTFQLSLGRFLAQV